MPVVSAVGVAAPNRSGRAARIEAAMLAELKKAQASGEKDPARLRQRMLSARDEAKRGAARPAEIKGR